MIGTIVERYIQLRDKKAELDQAHKAKMETINVALDKMEALLLAEFGKLGLDSAASPAGTAYKSVRSSAKVLDWDSTLAWIKANERWDILYRNVAKTAVEEFRNETQTLPPGIDWREEVTLNVRRK